VDGALRSSTMFGMATIAVGCSHVSGPLVQPFFTTAGPDVVREVGPNRTWGRHPLTRRRLSRLEHRPINIMPSPQQGLGDRDAPARAVSWYPIGLQFIARILPKRGCISLDSRLMVPSPPRNLPANPR
jgi:hypothetical protein